MNVVGIDPGLTGGIAVLSSSGAWLHGRRMPVLQVKQRKLIDVKLVMDFIGDQVGQVVVEAPNSMPRQGLQSTYNFGRHCGAVEAVALMTGAPVQLVTPSQWKGKLGVSSDKRASLDRARMEFGPHERWTVLANEGCAEAALIALWWLHQRPT